MNKKSIILAANLMLLCTTALLPITDQQEVDRLLQAAISKKNNTILEAIYAADNAGELARFADNKYIELLENKNKELQTRKSNCKSIFNKINYNMGYHYEDANGLGLDAHGLNIVATTANGFGFIAGGLKGLGYIAFINSAILYGQLFLMGFDSSLSSADWQKSYADWQSAYEIKSFTAISSLTGGFLLMLSSKEPKRIQRDYIIDALIEKNQAIITQLKEISQAV